MRARGKEIEGIEEIDDKWKEGFKLLLRVEKGNSSTPSLPWRHSLEAPLRKLDSSVSARKLCAKLWELQPLSQRSSIVRKIASADVSKPFNISFPDPSSSSRTYLPEDDYDSPDHRPKELGTNKISVELLKVLTKILSLEKHQSSNTLLIKALKAKLESTPRSKRWEMKRLKPQDYGEGKESFDYESQHSIFSSERKQERRKGSKMMENLCDEFSKEIVRYEQEVRRLRKKGESASEKPILHVAEAWIDGRMQMEKEKSKAEKDIIMSKLRHDIEAFLQGSGLCSIRESFPLGSASSTLVNESSSDCDCFGPQSDLHSLEPSYKNFFPPLKMEQRRAANSNSISSEGGKGYPNCEILPENKNTLREKLLEARLDDFKAHTKT